MKFSDLIDSTITAQPVLVRPEAAAKMIGSVEFLRELELAGWIKPVVRRNRLTLYSVRHIQACALRLEAGEAPSSMSESAGNK